MQWENHLEHFAILTHCHAHLALRHAVGTTEVDFKRVYTSLLAALNEGLPCVFVVLLHY